MEKTGLNVSDLEKQLEDLASEYRRLPPEDLFTLWFVRAYLTETLDQAAEAVCNGARDKGLDAIYIDDACKAVYLIQTKYRQDLRAKAECRSDVVSFVELARRFDAEDRAAFRELIAHADAKAASLLQSAYERVSKRNYRLEFCYVTLGNCSAAHETEARSVLRAAPCKAYFTLLDGEKTMNLLRDYLDGVAPPIPYLELEMERGSGVRLNGVMQRYASDSEIESWVFSMRGDAVAALSERGGIRIFARNVRGFLGTSSVNKTMETTLVKEPHNFFYYNNGITILCDDAQKESKKGQDTLGVKNPQIINGQQTTRTLAKMPEEAAKASVLVKVIKVPRNLRHDGFDKLVANVVAGTNRQNAVNAADLMTNDRTQIELERELRKRGYTYIRKRESKSEALARRGNRHFIPVKKEDLAAAVAGCELDPVVARMGRDKLFEEGRYTQIFQNSDPLFYLPKYWLMVLIGTRSRGKPEWGYAKWVVLGFAWTKLQPILRSRGNAAAFCDMFERRQHGYYAEQLGEAIDKIFHAVLRYHRANRGTGESAVDVSTFFRRHGHGKEFRKFWQEKGGQNASSFNKALARWQERFEEWKGQE